MIRKFEVFSANTAVVCTAPYPATAIIYDNLPTRRCSAHADAE